MEAVCGIDKLYALPDINDEAVRHKMKNIIDRFDFGPLRGHSPKFIESIKSLSLEMVLIGAKWMREQLTGK